MQFTSKYPLKPYQVTNFEKIKLIIATYPLATLISQSDPYPTVTQVPLILNDDGSALLGHVDRNNPHCERIQAGGAIYCTFHGPNHYMSPTIYPDEQYPGWNYVSVHVQGEIAAITDEPTLADVLTKTALHNEPQESSYQLLPSQTNYQRLIKRIVGFEIRIVDIKAIIKLAQDKGSPHCEIARDHLSNVATRDISPFLHAMLE